MAKIVADPGALRTAGNQMLDIAAQFQSEYQAMLQAAQDTQTGWQGEDNSAFVTKVVGLQDDYARLYQLLHGCGNDLVQSAQKYENTQNEVGSRANSLVADI